MPSESTPQRPGVLIADRYHLHKKLGSGAAGVVYLGLDERLDRQVAVKLLHPQEQKPLRQKAEGEARFIHEARAAAKLNHPGLCGVFDFGRYGDQLFLVMAYIDGVALSTLIDSKRGKNLKVTWILNIVSQIADAMAAAHDAGIIHYDLKPENVVVRRSDHRPVVMDFGLAGAAEATANDGNAFFGSPAYMAPEQACGELTKLGTHCDVYALGATMYELLTGRLPFDGTLDEVMLKLRDPLEEPAAPIDLKPSIPSSLSDLCRSMLSKSIEDRPGSMRTITERLAEIALSLPSDTVPPSSATPPDTIIRSTSSGVPPSLSPTPAEASTWLGRFPPAIVPSQRVLQSKSRWMKWIRKRDIRKAFAIGGVMSIVGAAGLTVWWMLPANIQSFDPGGSARASTERLDGNRPGSQPSARSPQPSSTVSPKSDVAAGVGVNKMTDLPVPRGDQAIDWYQSLISNSRMKPEPLTIDFLNVYTDLQDWKVCPHEQRTEWTVGRSELQTAANDSSPSVFFCPAPIEKFELSFEYRRTVDAALQLIWTNSPGWSNTATASLTFNPAGRGISTWKCYETNRTQSQTYYGNEKFAPWIPVTVSCDGYTVFVRVPGKQAARYGRTGGGRIKGYLGVRQIAQATQIRNVKFVDRTVNQAQLWSEHPSAVFVDQATKAIKSPRVDLWGERLAVVQQASANPSGSYEPVRRGTIFGLDSGGILQTIDDRMRSPVPTDWVVLTDLGFNAPFSMIAAKGTQIEMLPNHQTQLAISDKPLGGDDVTDSRLDSRHRWAITRMLRESDRSEFHLVGVTPDGKFRDLASSGLISGRDGLADFAAKGKRWLLAGKRTLSLRGALGRQLNEQSLDVEIDSIAIFDDGQRALVATEKKALVQYDWGPSGNLSKVSAFPIPVRFNELEISLDGRYALATTDGNRCVLFSTKNNELLRIFENTVGMGIFTADSRSIVLPFRSDAVAKVFRIDTLDATSNGSRRSQVGWSDLRTPSKTAREAYSQTYLGGDAIERRR